MEQSPSSSSSLNHDTKDDDPNTLTRQDTEPLIKVLEFMKPKLDWAVKPEQLDAIIKSLEARDLSVLRVEQTRLFLDVLLRFFFYDSGSGSLLTPSERERVVSVIPEEELETWHPELLRRRGSMNKT